MSEQACNEPQCLETRQSAIDLVIEPRPRDLGGFEVRRVLPSSKKRLVGPFVFWDEMGPAVFPPGSSVNVRPHPHIGLATITYLFDGRILHRDSLGYVQAIEPGAVNWMTAGKGIVHSERTLEEDLPKERAMHGIQAWVALPADKQEIEPAFEHYPADSLPVLERPGVKLTLIAGTALGEVSPVAAASPLFYIDAQLQGGARFQVPEEHEERAVYPVSGEIRLNGERLEAHSMAVLTPGQEVELEAANASRVLLLGGQPFPEKRFIWWNFVSTSQDRIEQAKADWKAGKFDPVPGDDEEFIPLPEG